MEVYIEYVITDNFIIDYFLLSLALKYSKAQVNKKRIALSAAIGTIVAILMPIFNASAAIKFFIKIALAFVMIIVAAKHKSGRGYFFSLCLFLIFTIIFGGAAMLLMNFLCLDYDFFYGSSAFPLGLSLLAAAILYKLLVKGFTVLFEKKMIYPFVRRCVLECGEKKVEASGLIDSGNHLIYTGGFAVCVPSLDLADKLAKSGFFERGILGEMAFDTAAGKSAMKIYEIDRMVIYSGGKRNIIDRPKIGVALSVKSFSDDYDLILSAAYAAM